MSGEVGLAIIVLTAVAILTVSPPATAVFSNAGGEPLRVVGMAEDIKVVLTIKRGSQTGTGMRQRRETSIAFLLWFFFGPKQGKAATVRAGVQEATIRVEGAYQPRLIGRRTGCTAGYST